MSKFTPDADSQRQRIYRAAVVHEYGPDDVSFFDHLQATNPDLRVGE